MTLDEMNSVLKSAQNAYSSPPAQVKAQGDSAGEAAAPSTDMDQMLSPSSSGEQRQDEDKYGTGFINYADNKNQDYRKQFQSIPDSSGSLYDPTAALPTNPAGTVGQGVKNFWPGAQSPTSAPPIQAGPPTDDPNAPGDPGNGPIMKPYGRLRELMGYGGGGSY